MYISLYFNPRSPHGERRLSTSGTRATRNFNPRSPHGERLTCSIPACAPLVTFQPTLPARGATGRRRRWLPAAGISTHAPRTGSDHGEQHHCRLAQISTHAPRTGSDPVCEDQRLISSHFNPRSPHGERPKGKETTRETAGFQPTLPARGATPSGGQSHRRSS